eukprot:3585431-Alexandrium_andersonii.AAC.1
MQIQHQRDTWHIMHPSRASGTIVEVVYGAAQFKLRAPQATSVFSRFGSATSQQHRFDRFDWLLGSIGTRCTGCAGRGSPL